jgi:mannitol-specific phosphotransferase system IIBC component
MGIKSRIDRLIEITLNIAFFMIVLVFVYGIIGLVLAFPVLYLWNWVMPSITNNALSAINYWQAWGLIVLLGILLGNSASGAGGE